MRFVAITLVLALTACSSGSDSGTSAGRRGTVSTSRVACADGMGAFDELPDGFDSVLDQVALPTSDVQPTALQTSDRRGGDGPRLFAKTGLVVRRGAHAEIAAAPAAEGRLWFEWGTSDAPSAEIVVDGCGSSTPEQWIAVAGGYWVDEPGCWSVRVTAAGDRADRRAEDVTIGVGAPCPGQLPPPEPSDG